MNYPKAVGEGAAVLFYSYLVAVVVVPVPLWPVSYRAMVYGFVGVLGLAVLVPPASKLVSDAFPPMRSLSSYLGRFPLMKWGLYYYPLSFERLDTVWPDGLYYPTIKSDAFDERLLLDGVAEPMNFSGLVLHVVSVLMESDDRTVRVKLIAFLYDFLELKAEFYRRSGSYSISKRYLGRLSFPTANTHEDPDVDISSDRDWTIRIYHVRWPESADDFVFDPENIEWAENKQKELVAEYTRENGRVVEERFSP